MLTFNDHITDICKKSARQLAVLKRLGNLLTLQGKFCPLIWHFCSQCSTNKLEKVQERALRFVYNDYVSSHADLLKTAGAEYLHIKRVKEMAREVFKIVNNIAPTFIENLIALKQSKYSIRNDKPAVLPRANTTE